MRASIGRQPHPSLNLGGTPLPLVAGSERLVSFSVPAGTPSGVIEIDGDGDGTSAFVASLSSP